MGGCRWGGACRGRGEAFGFGSGKGFCKPFPCLYVDTVFLRSGKRVSEPAVVYALLRAAARTQDAQGKPDGGQLREIRFHAVRVAGEMLW